MDFFFGAALVDPVVGTIIVAIVGSAISGLALVRSSKTNSTTAAIGTLVEGQQKALTRLDGLLAAKDSIIEDLREDLGKCHSEREALSREVDRQGVALGEAEKAIKAQAAEIRDLHKRMKEIGNERHT